MEQQVIVPAGCGPGTELRIAVEGREYLVTVPDDCEGGSAFVVHLPEDVTPSEESFEVVVPDGVSAGDEFVLTLAHGDFVVSVPDGSGPGQPMRVQIPKPQDHQPEQHMEEEEQDHGIDSERPPPDELSGSSSETESETGDGKFAVGMPVEVMRTDGLWTLCTVVEYDPAGGTYTVQLADGRCKYFVEPDWLRLPAFLFQSNAVI